jgi:hypothetical protein
MDVTVTPRRDRAARHHAHHKIVCISSAPTAVRTLQRRSRRAAERAELFGLLADALDERRQALAE